MMRAATAFAVLALAAPAAAQDCAGEHDKLLALVENSDLEITDSGQRVPSDRGCRLQGLRFSDGRYLQFEVGQIDWRAEGLEALDTGEPAVLSLDIEVTEVRLFPQPPDPWVAWMLDIQNRGNLIDGRLLARWDVAAGLMQIDEFSVDFPGANSVSLATTVTGIDFGLMAGAAGFDTLRLMRFDLEVENEGYIDSLYLALLMERMRGLGDDPAAVAAKLQQKARGFVRILPDVVFPAASRDALLRLIDAGPAPWGRLTVSVATGEGLPLDRFVDSGLAADPYAPDVLAVTMAGGTVEVTYEGQDRRR